MPMEFRVYFFPRISAFLSRTKMHLNGMLLIGTDFFKIIVPYLLVKSTFFSILQHGSKYHRKSHFSRLQT